MGVSWRLNGAYSRENTRFPVKFPVSRELIAETRSISTASPANQSGLYDWHICIAIIRAVAGLSARCGGLWTPELVNPSTVLPEISGHFRRCSQISGADDRRPVRSQTARWGRQSLSVNVRYQGYSEHRKLTHRCLLMTLSRHSHSLNNSVQNCFRDCCGLAWAQIQRENPKRHEHAPFERDPALVVRGFRFWDNMASVSAPG